METSVDTSRIVPTYGHPFSLFVTLPSSEVQSLRDLGAIVSSREVREKLELVAGIPSEIYSLVWPDGTELMTDHQISFGQTIRNGAVIKAVIHPRWEELYRAVERNAKREVYRLIKEYPAQKKASHEDESKMFGDSKKGDVDYYIFLTLFLACSRGMFDMVKHVIGQYGLPQRMTSYGRSLLHATVSKDHILLVRLLLQQGHDPNIEDDMGASPFAVALDIGACASLRVLRGHLTLKIPGAQTTNDHRPARQVKSAPAKIRSQTQTVKPHNLQFNFGKTQNILVDAQKHLENARNNLIQKNAPSDNVLSAGSMSAEVRATCIRSAYHGACSQPKPFIMKRTISPSEGKKLVTVEFTPAHRPCNDGVAESKDTQKNPYKNMLAPGQSETKTRRRTKPTKYFESKYHKMAKQEEEYNAIPEGAGPRFRFWKTWLLEKLEEDKMKKAQDAKNVGTQKKNDLAYSNWLRQKEREGFGQDSESSEDDNNSDTQANQKAFLEWLEKKKVIFARKAKLKREKAALAQEMAVNGPSKVYDRKVTIFEMTSTEPLPVRYENPNRYHTAYTRWKERRVRYEAWKDENHPNGDCLKGDLSRADCEKERESLLLQGITYEEWLGLKQRQGLVT